LDHILFFDAARNGLSNVTYTLVRFDPEPSVFSLIGIGLPFFLTIWTVRTKFAGLNNFRLSYGFCGMRPLGPEELVLEH